ncbi:cytochrome d ubiquinol oxidase subunit II [Pseudovibrio sp. SPO723]|uniref:cytochrome d ubiquinol oxidase subunit II n=1 Tax=Nesiotobacter zosterae TaxID=392721 RepID=UPI0029C22A0A|nr:cytochrome d ubiquinol oxidase subunit II [Pseudovibrio sp. SPO723]MDX5592428.1 cytochrome d ubiquinol oxidase subunit II [Pseudovibrio sp. SPO723]
MIFGDPTISLPIIFAVLLGFSILVYVVLDGFDLGVGLLSPLTEEVHRDKMIASIGPFWDANETWLVLAVGLLLVAFPAAHGTILTALYAPVFILLLGLTLRGVAFEFRAKAPAHKKKAWDAAFFAGSLMASLSQGFMLGLYIMGLQFTQVSLAFACLTAVFLTVGYSFIGATWLIMKTAGELQLKAIRWARQGLWGVGLGLIAISFATPFASERIFSKWLEFPEAILLAPLPLMSLALLAMLWLALQRLPTSNDSWAWAPFAFATTLFFLAFCGLAYSFYPYVVPEKLTIYEAAAAPESLFIILVGACVVMPIIFAYSALSFFIFRGKATELRYD